MIPSDPGETRTRRAPGLRRRSLVAYLSPKGRVPGTTYVVWFLGPCILGGIALSSVVERRSIVGFAVFALLYWIYLAGFAKRLQDFGLPGLPIATPVVVGLWLDLEAGLGFPPWLETYLYALFTIGVLFAGLTAGQSGDNRYGPDPVASKLARAPSAGDPGEPPDDTARAV